MLHCMNLIEFFDQYLYLTIQDAINDIEKGNYDNVSKNFIFLRLKQYLK